MIKVVAPRMAQNVVDRAMQVCFRTLQTIQLENVEMNGAERGRLMLR